MRDGRQQSLIGKRIQETFCGKSSVGGILPVVYEAHRRSSPTRPFGGGWGLFLRTLHHDSNHELPCTLPLRVTPTSVETRSARRQRRFAPAPCLIWSASSTSRTLCRLPSTTRFKNGRNFHTPSPSDHRASGRRRSPTSSPMNSPQSATKSWPLQSPVRLSSTPS